MPTSLVSVWSGRSGVSYVGFFLLAAPTSEDSHPRKIMFFSLGDFPLLFPKAILKLKTPEQKPYSGEAGGFTDGYQEGSMYIQLLYR